MPPIFGIIWGMKNKVLSWISCRRWFVGFTVVFASLMAFVFWGTWSPDVAAVMPDDNVCHPLSYWSQLRGSINIFLAKGKITPCDVFWFMPVVSKYWLQEFKYAFSAYCAALGLVYFLRGRGLSPLASYGSGLLLAFCGYWFSLFSAGHGGWFVWMTYGVAAFGLVDRAVRYGRMRHWVLLGACIAWGSCHQPDLWLIFTLFTGFYALAVCAWERRFPWKGLLVSVAVFAVIGAANVYDAFAGALTGRDQQIADISSQKFAASAGGEADPAAKAKADRETRWIFVTNWSLPLGETVEFFKARVNGDTSCPMTLQCARAAGKDTKPYTGALGRPFGAPAGNYRQHSLYVGWITCLLALLGVVFAIRRSESQTVGQFRPVALFFAVAAVLCWLLSLGRNCEPIYRVVFALPFGDYMRAPVKWHHLTELSLCVLAGFGIEGLRGFGGLRKFRGFGGVGGTVVLGAVVLIGAVDLARIDKLYCAPIDMRIVRGVNAAADFVEKAGGGKVADLVERGNGLLAWGLRAHETSVTGNPSDEGVRFLWVGTQQVAQDKNLAAYVKAKARPVGYYMATANGVFSVQPNNANLALYQLDGVPAPEPKSKWGKVRGGILAMGLLSVLGSVGVLCVFSRQTGDKV